MNVIRCLFLSYLLLGLLPLSARESAYVTPEMFGAAGDGVSNDYVPFMKAIESGRKVKCDGIYFLSSSVHPSVTKDISIEGRGTIIYDFHINCNANLSVNGLKLTNTGKEVNGLFASKGTALFKDVYLEGLSNCKLDGGISFKGSSLKVESCTFDKSDINIVSKNAVFKITNCIFDCKSVNSKDNLSNEPIHLQRCKKGVIKSCEFKNSLQDVIDFYFGAHNVTVSNCIFDDVSTTVFEIKAEYRDNSSTIGGNQVYEDFTSNITIKDNHFRNVSAQVLFWIGTRSDERKDRSHEDHYYVRNVVICNNDIEIVADKCDVFLCRNAKDLTFKNNKISSSGSVFLFRSMSDNPYESNHYCRLINNRITCTSSIIAYIQGHNDGLYFEGNEISHSLDDSFLILQEPQSDINGITFKANKNAGRTFRVGTESKTIHGKDIAFVKQSFGSCHVGNMSGYLKYQGCSFQCKPIVSGGVNDLFVYDCDSPGFLSTGKILRVEVKKSRLNAPLDEVVIGGSVPNNIVSKRNKKKY